jgi:Family of unknown function (DUF5757)
MAVSLTDFDSEYTAALKIASESGVLVSHMRRLPDGEYEAWDNEFLAEPYSDAWLDLQYERLEPLYPEVAVENYVWYLLDIWGDLDHGIYESLEDALPSINAFLKAHNQREYQTMQMMQSDRAYRRKADERVLNTQAEDAQALAYYQEYLTSLRPHASTDLVMESEHYALTFRVADGWAVVQGAKTSEVMPWVLSTGVPGVDEPVLRMVERVPPAAVALLPSAPLPPGHLWVAVQQGREYVVIDMDLRLGTSSVEIPTGVETFLERLATLLPGVQWGEPRRLSVRGEYILPSLTLSEYVLADLVTTDALLSSYLSLNETDPSPIKGRSRIGALWNKSRFILYFKQLQSTEKVLHALFNQSTAGVGDVHGMVPGTPYVRVTILKGPSEDSVRLFYAVFNRLMTYYTEQAPTVLNEYQALLGQGQTGTLAPRKSERLARQEDQVTRNERLRMALPDVFVSGYARMCQAPLQPEILQEDEETPEGWQVLPYPAPPQNKLQLVCPASAPYPTVIPNTLESKGVVGYLPCCTTTNQMDLPTSAYTRIYKEGKDVTEAFPPVRTRTTLQNEERVLDYNRTGKLLPILESMVQSATATRLGSWPSPSNFLLAVLQAIGSVPADVSDVSLDALRQALPLPHPELLSQEMWDVPMAERVAWFRDPKRFLDPQLFLRALEEAYDLNIYLFSSEENVPVVLLPRYFQFPCRPFRARRCALVYVHAEERRCELIVDGDKTIWDEGMNMRLYALNKSLCTTEMRTETGTAVNPQNIYQWHRHVDQATHQILDPYGKLQGLVFQTAGLTLLGPPGAPLPLPAWPADEPFPTSGDPRRVVELMDGYQPKRTYPGVLEYDYPQGVRVRWHVAPLPSSPLDALATQQTTTALLLQCTNLLFYLHTHGEMTEEAVEPWVRQACVVRPGTAYVPTLLSPYLPPLATEAEGAEYLAAVLPSFFDAGRLALPSEAFQRRLVQHLRRFVRMYRAESTVVPNVLLGAPLRLPVPTSDTLWVGPEVEVARARPTPKDAEVVTALTPALLERSQPVVMRQDGRLFLVLPKQPDMDTALVVADNWRTTGRVLALGVRPVPTAYVVLELTDLRTWAVKERVGTENTTLMVLSTGRRGWAAVLPL